MRRCSTGVRVRQIRVIQSRRNLACYLTAWPHLPCRTEAAPASAFGRLGGAHAFVPAPIAIFLRRVDDNDLGSLVALGERTISHLLDARELVPKPTHIGDEVDGFHGLLALHVEAQLRHYRGAVPRAWAAARPGDDPKTRGDLEVAPVRHRLRAFSSRLFLLRGGRRRQSEQAAGACLVQGSESVPQLARSPLSTRCLKCWSNRRIVYITILQAGSVGCGCSPPTTQCNTKLGSTF